MNNRTKQPPPSEFFIFCDLLRGYNIFRKHTHNPKFKYEVFIPQLSAQIAKQLIDNIHPDFYAKPKSYPKTHTYENN